MKAFKTGICACRVIRVSCAILKIVFRHGAAFIPRHIKSEMNYLPVNVFGEQIVIDYHQRELVFPNRNDGDFDGEFSSRICAYLNEEGFLVFGSKSVVGHKSNTPPVHLGPEKSVLSIGKKINAVITYTRSLAETQVLVGFYWDPTSYCKPRVCDFNLESLGELETSGTEMRHGKLGWAVYEGETFTGKLGDSIELKGVLTGAENIERLNISNN